MVDKQYSTDMVAPSPLRRCAMVLCYLAAPVFWRQGVWRDFMATADGQFQQQFQRLRLATVSTTHLTQAPETLATANLQIVIYLGQRQLVLLQNDQVIKDFPVAIGQDDWQTPVGTFKVQSMRKQPHWQHPITKQSIGPGPDNPLGNRWIGFFRRGGIFHWHPRHQTRTP